MLHAELLSFAWTFLFLQIKKPHANHQVTPDQVLSQEGSVIWFLDIFDQKGRLIEIHSSAERAFPSQTSSRPPRFPFSPGKRCAPAPLAFQRGGLIPAAVSGEGCAPVPMETI